MMLALWRVDAQHEADGALTLFRLEPYEAEHEADRLRRAGWDVDVYREAPPAHVPAPMVMKLLLHTWPNAPLPTLVALARAGSSRSPLEQARRDLEAIQKRQQEE